jgi:eukaryotic-like serine/threonine-protein kinase
MTRLPDLAVYFSGSMHIAPSRRLAHYELSTLLGRGGMGEVWQATDTRLGRQVALKVLPAEFVGDPERLARFEREARLLASLRHPNIAAIHGIEQADGERFLVMDLAEGEDLSKRIARGALPVAEAVAIAIAVAEALEAAHDRGIVHRDLKPANIRVTPDGHVTVLDFGLGKSMEAGETANELSNSPTMVQTGTELGVILGTAAYMSPEQARGRRVDRRADNWAFGVVLWEMLVGARLFGGATMSDTLAAVAADPVEFDAVPAETPANVRWVLCHCLERDLRQRLRDIGDARLVLAGPPDMGVAHPAPPAPARSSRFLPLTLAVLLLLAALGVTAWFRMRPAETPLRKLDLVIGLTGMMRASPAISPDGKSVLYPVERGLAVRDLDDFNGRIVAEAHDVTFACWSPDSRQIAFVSRGRLWRAGRDGKPPVTVAALPKHLAGSGGLAWLPGNRIIIAGSNHVGLIEVPALGGNTRETVPLAKPGERDFHELSPLPGAEGLLVLVHEEGKPAGRFDAVRNGRREMVLRMDGASLASPVYSPTGHIVFQQERAGPEVWAVPFSLRELRTTGEPFLIGSGSAPSVDENGTLAYIRGSTVTKRQLLRVDRTGRTEAEIGRPSNECYFPAIAPDGTRVAAGVMEGSGVDIAVFDAETRTVTRLTSAPGVEWQPHWSPDGQRIAFGTGVRDQVALLDLRTGQQTSIGEGSTPRWSPDGTAILVTLIGNDGSLDIGRYDLTTGNLEVMIAARANEHDPVPSPDGRLLAYLSDESGRDEVFVRELGGERRTIQVSSNGSAGAPRWSPQGDELFYRTGEALFAVARTPDGRFSFADPQPLFTFAETGIDRLQGSFDVTPDGKGFIVTRDVTDEATRAILTIVTNWFSEFEKRK